MLSSGCALHHAASPRRCQSSPLRSWRSRSETSPWYASCHACSSRALRASSRIWMSDNGAATKASWQVPFSGRAFLPDHPVHDVGDAGCLDRAHLLDLEVADVLEQPLAVAEQDRRDVEPELIDQPRGEVLLDDTGPSTEQDVLVARDPLRLFEGRSDPVGDEEEGGASFPLLGLTPVMRQGERA